MGEWESITPFNQSVASFVNPLRLKNVRSIAGLTAIMG
jgi:hypothetical protein